MSDTLWSPGLQHARRPCPSPTPGACSNSCPSPRWCQASEWLDLNTHTGSWPPVSPAPLTPVSPLPPVHSTCVFITPDFIVTRKMKKKANPSDNEGIRVQYKLLRFSYFMCRATIWSVQVPNFLNLRQKWKKKKKRLLPAKHYNCSHIESCIKITWVLFTVPLSRLYFWPKTLDVGFGNFDV